MNPTLYHFLDEIMLEESDARHTHVASAAGHSPPRQRKKYTVLDERVERIIHRYEAYKDAGNIPDYLKALGLAFGGTSLYSWMATMLTVMQLMTRVVTCAAMLMAICSVCLSQTMMTTVTMCTLMQKSIKNPHPSHSLHLQWHGNTAWVMS